MNSIELDIRNGINWREINKQLRENPNLNVIIQIENTKNLTSSQIERIIQNHPYEKRIMIQIRSGYDEERIRNYPDSKDRLTTDNIYSLRETQKILEEIENIEREMNPNLDEVQKLVYFIARLGEKIIYHPFHEIQPSKEIRSLRGLISGKTVCAGYAIILKEICDRNNIECDYVEGCTNEDDAKKGYRTHAWNIVKINGNYIPLDLTWNAGKRIRGNIMAIEDIANVNAFIKGHIPGKHEKIRDYEQSLKSIKGEYLQVLDILINKDSYNNNKIFYGIRDDNTRYMIAQDTVIQRDNQYFIQYVYYDIYPNGTLGKPTILYSKTSVSQITYIENQRKKWKKELEEARKNNDTEKAQELSEKLRASFMYHKANHMVDNLLFSKKNITEAIRRGDHYVGTIAAKDNKITGVEINPRHAKMLNIRQKTFERSDKTTFVLEEVRPLKLGEQTIHRYILYERIGKGVKRNTIYSDQDLLSDSRSAIPNALLSRERINRKQVDTNGYIGYLTQKGEIVYQAQLNNFFQKEIPLHTRFKKEYLMDYHPDITFEEMKRLVKTYQLDDHYRIINRYTKKEMQDKDLQLKTYFSLAWLHSAGVKYYTDEEVPGYRYAFNSQAEKIFDKIVKMITDSVNKYGNINPVEILDNIIKNHEYKYEEDIVIRLFGNKVYVKMINKLFREQNPSAVPEKESIHFNQYGSSTDAYQKLGAFIRQQEQELEDMLEVREENGTVQIVPKSK